MNKIKSFFDKIFGNIEYVVTIISVDGSVQKHLFSKIIEINGERYFNIQKIEKFRRYDFSYKKQILQSPLFFYKDDVTEMEYFINHEYSFIKKDVSLKNIERVLIKNINK